MRQTERVRTTFSLGRIAGIRIGLNWSVLALLALMVWTLSNGVFPETNPGIGDDVYFAMAVVAAILFFCSILLHELGHAIQARRDGVPIEGITLWLFGGVAVFRGGFPSAGAEFRIAVAGPIVSLVLGGACLGAAELPGLPEPVDAVASWLGFINLFLLAFNLLPALPLDGGRMLRAGLWRWKGDLAAATAIAARIARVLAILVIAGGVALTVMASAVSGIWLVFVGWFLLQAAANEGRSAVARTAVGDLRARDAMVRDPIATRPDATLAQFVEESVWGTRHTAYPVLEGGRPVGLMLVSRLSAVPQDAWARHRVGELMVPLEQVPVLAPGDEIIAALEAIAHSVPGRALVLEGDRLVGLLSSADVRRALELRGFRVASSSTSNGSRS
ncbi:MAG: hypothetical protein QOD86_499 [Miltoncostaeaceae bacterium]|jgi:Zn-dependent protease|nr:hypothetical protein [Miltoncostaeaceae bacterium]